MKVCVKCKQEKTLSEFNKHKSSKDGLQPWCKQCVKKGSINHYHKEKETIKQKNKHINDERIKWFKEYKSTLKCSKCDENHPATLDFHHRNKNEKKETISNLVWSRGSIKALLKEIEKCDVLCANCHRKLHWEEENKSISIT